MFQTKLVLKKIAGVLLILYGIIALVTPLTPGFWLLFVGAELLGLELLILEKPIAFLEEKLGGKPLKQFKKKLQQIK